MQKKLKPVTYGLILLLIFSFLASGILITGFNPQIYKHAYNNNKEIAEFSGYDENTYLKEIDRLKVYLFNSRENDRLLSAVYSEDEVAHMVDVYYLFRLLRIINAICVLLSCTIIIRYRKNLAAIDISRRWYLFILIPLFLILPVFINFDAFWIKFHKVLFRNDLWLMDPDVSLMINLLPIEVFYSISVGTIILYLVAIVIICLIFRYYARRENGI
ncbi:MAG: TIGR01906 family membrane protein [Ezakiella sp.]|nr:TIGR01906 family membrane protein [Ezakiella sp.]MDD7472067.1 TIGR01906 family membrane protein [Bacillota bacterium]MDY3924031.1 TIGR01906 family membrane protein [Ezakiella sp.]